MSKTLVWTASLASVIFYVVACSPVKFGASDNPGDGFAFSCSQNSSGCKFDYMTHWTGPKVDILIVDDNSASMSFEQKALASRFNGFIQQLDAKHVDYRIAITTTDIHVDGDNNGPRPINGNGALQNGNLISFGNGINYLTPSVADRVGRFNNTIVRPETLQCEQFIANYVSQYGIASINSSDYQNQYKTNCPSGDERGTYAANLAIKNNSGSFMRSDAYLAIIFVSDEDVRSGQYCSGPLNLNCSLTGYPLEDMDQPLSLFNTLKAQGKHLTTEIHAVVVMDNACLAEQSSQVLGNPPVAATAGAVSGSVGNIYLNFPNNGWGVAVSICMDNYTAALDPISNKISGIQGEVLACDSPIGLQVTPVPADSSFSYTQNGKNITYNKTLAPGTQVHFVYSCPNNF
jgi:hypothetical protein